MKTALPWFQISVIACFTLFCSLMLYVAWAVWQRPSSGLMGIDAAKIQVLRLQADRDTQTNSKVGQRNAPKPRGCNVANALVLT